METVEAPTTILLRQEAVVVSPCKMETKTTVHEGGASKRRETKIMENHYYESIYEVLQDNRPPEEKFVKLN